MGAALASPLLRAQPQSARLRRIGWLTGGSPKSHAQLLGAFRDGLREHGWVEGRNITLELRWAEGDLVRLQPLAEESAAELKLPLVGPFEEWADAGALMSYAVSLVQSYRRAASYVDKILRGANPAVLARADRVIE